MGKKANPLVLDLVNRFLVAQKPQLTQSTWKFYRQYLRMFAKSCGHLHSDDVTPGLAAEWVAKHYGKRSTSSQFNAARAVCRMFHWAEAERLISFYPLKGFRKATPTRREMVITPRQYAALLKAASSHSILAVVKFLYHTGARPQELRKIRAEWINGRKIILPVAESKGRKKNRVILLDDTAYRIVTKLAGRGIVFRSPTGKPWTKANLIGAMRKLRRDAKVPGLCSYTFRHSFCTRLLERGVDVATVAALAGNTPQTIFKHYSHVEKNEDRLLAVLKS